MTLLFDSETDGLLSELTRVHCLCLMRPDEAVPRRYHDDPGLPRDGSLSAALEQLECADEIVAHNLIGFDLPALVKVYPGWAPRGRLRDSLTIARTIWPEEHLKSLDSTSIRRLRPLPPKLVGRHSLKAWGHRLRDLKGESPTSWKHLTPELLDYCAQDVSVLTLLWARIQAHGPTTEQIELEQAFAPIVQRQIERGFMLDRSSVANLTMGLVARRATLDRDLREAFPDFRDEYETPKMKLRRTRVTVFNPNSRAHIARGLTEKHGWRPKEFTDDGSPKMDEAVVRALPYPEARLIGERLMVQKRLGQVAEGEQAWLKLVKDDGRVHGVMLHNAAVTARCTHSRPNMSAVPKMDKPWGPECRRCWVAAPGHVLVVTDAAGIDARVLGHYAAKFDGGELASMLLEGDLHQRNADVLGTSRHKAKTLLYATLYGAQAGKAAKILGTGAAAGKAGRQKLLNSMPGLNVLIKAVTAHAAANGWVRTLDGRRLWIRKRNAALNTLIQGGSSILLKKAIVLADGGPVGWTGSTMVAFVHDEVVLEVPDAGSLSAQAGAAMRAAIVEAGVHFKLRVPLDAKTVVGKDWSAKE